MRDRLALCNILQHLQFWIEYISASKAFGRFILSNKKKVKGFQ